MNRYNRRFPNGETQCDSSHYHSVGPAAGPHTQLAQNIVTSWLTGGRFIELKTVQILDRLELEKPCIDAEELPCGGTMQQPISVPPGTCTR